MCKGHRTYLSLQSEKERKENSNKTKRKGHAHIGRALCARKPRDTHRLRALKKVFEFFSQKQVS